MTFKTIKELEADVDGNVVYQSGYRKALKDIKKLIDEMPVQEIRGIRQSNWINREELKAKIDGK